MNMGRVTSSLALIVLVAACGSNPGTTSPARRQSPSTVRAARTTDPAIPDSVQAQLRNALDAWSTFPVDTSDRPLVLTSDPVSAPAEGFGTDDAKEAFLTGAFTAPPVLPSGPQVDGGYPVITAAQALALMRADGSPADGKTNVPTPLVITSVRFGESSFVTDRGTRTLPAWLFTFAEVQNPAAVLAVAPSSQFAAPTRLSAALGARLDQDGRTLTVTFTGAEPGPGPCGADYSVFQAASETAVGLFVRESPHPMGTNVSCASVGYLRHEVVALAARLGNRVLVDAQTQGAVQIAP
jgi:hypothetical protein